MDQDIMKMLMAEFGGMANPSGELLNYIKGVEQEQNIEKLAMIIVLSPKGSVFIQYYQDLGNLKFVPLKHLDGPEKGNPISMELAKVFPMFLMVEGTFKESLNEIMREEQAEQAMMYLTTEVVDGKEEVFVIYLKIVGKKMYYVLDKNNDVLKMTFNEILTFSQQQQQQQNEGNNGN